MRSYRSRSETAGGDSSTSLMDILGNSLGGVLFLLILIMVIMVLLPSAMSSLKPLRLLPPEASPSNAIRLPPATIGEKYLFLFATEGGNEYVSVELVSGTIPSGLTFEQVTHETGDEKTSVGLAGTPQGPPKVYEFALRARASEPRGEAERERWAKQPDRERYLLSPVMNYTLEVLEPSVLRRDEVEQVRITCPDALPPCRLLGGEAKVQVGATGGVPPYEWSLTSRGIAPDESLAIGQDGSVAARLKSPRTVAFSISVQSRSAKRLQALGMDSQKLGASKNVTWQVLPAAEDLTIVVPENLSPVVAGGDYAVGLAARGGTGNYAWTLLPAGVEGQGGTPPPAWAKIVRDALTLRPPDDAFRKEPYVFRIRVEDGLPRETVVSKLVRVVVTPAPLVTLDPADPASKLRVTTQDRLPAATGDEEYGVMLAAEGGRPPYHWSVTACSLGGPGSPEGEKRDLKDLGLALSGNGWLSGTPTAAGDCRLAVNVRDSNAEGGVGARSAAATLTLRIKPSLATVQTPPLVILTPPALPDGVAGSQYQLAFSSIGGLPPYEWSLENIPPGFSLRIQDPAKGVLAGIPALEEIGSHDFVVKLMDQRGAKSAARLKVSLRIRPGTRPLQVVTKRLPDAAVNREYEAPLVAEGGEGPATWSLIGGQLPPGLKLDAAKGSISGTPARVTDRPAKVRVRARQMDGAAAESDVAVSVLPLVSPAPLRIVSEPDLPRATVGVPYAVQLAADGGVPPYGWKRGRTWPDLTAGAVNVSPSGLLENPAFPAAKKHALSVVVADALGQEVSKDLRIEVLESGQVVPPAIRVVTPADLPPAVGGQHYSLALSAEGGVAPYYWNVQGDLPKGLSLDKGALTGKPQVLRTQTFTLIGTVHDAQLPPGKATRQFSLKVLRGAGGLTDWIRYLGYLLVYLGYIVLTRGNERDYGARLRRIPGLHNSGTPAEPRIECETQEARDQLEALFAGYQTKRKTIIVFTILAALSFTAYLVFF